MLNPIDAHACHRRTRQRIEQHAPQRIAQRLPKAALQRVDHKLAIPIVLADFNALDFWLFDLIDHLAFPPSRRRAFQAQAVFRSTELRGKPSETCLASRAIAQAPPA